MGRIRVGTASWTDKTLTDSGWYPPEANTPDKRLRYYARQFPLVEADATYYALPAESAAEAWAARTPVEFRNRTWMTEENQRETLDFLSAHRLPYVRVDMPQGYPGSAPRCSPPPATWPWSGCTATPASETVPDRPSATRSRAAASPALSPLAADADRRVSHPASPVSHPPVNGSFHHRGSLTANIAISDPR